MMTATNVRQGWVAALCCAGLWIAGCTSTPPPISLVEPDAGPRADAARPRPDAASPPGVCDEGCFVEGVCYRAGAIDPENPCGICRPATDPRAFTANDGASCDDGQFCTTRDFCVGLRCVGTTPPSCDDGVACTLGDRCDEASDSCVPGESSCAAGTLCETGTGACVTECAGCEIGGVCVADGTRNPANPCQVCDIARTARAWSANDGVTCDDGRFCTVGDSCAAGLCVGAARECGDGIDCNGVEVCNDTTDRCLSGVSACAAGATCDPDLDVCVAACTGCAIGGTCFAAAAVNPLNPCEVCDPSRTTEAWSAYDGVTCDDGNFCTVSDVCSAGSCGGVARSCDDGIACTGAERCDETANACVAGAPACAAGQLCDVTRDTCVLDCDGCVVAGVCVPAGTTNPLNVCEICDPSQSAVAFSPNDGVRCDDGLFCTVGDSCGAGVCVGGADRVCGDGVACTGEETCDESLDRCEPGVTACDPSLECDASLDECVACSGCVIAGICHANGVADPANPCQACDTTQSSTTWSPLSGTACDDGDACTLDDVCAAGSCAGIARACSDDVACNGLEVCDGATGACTVGVPTCGVGESCDTDADACVEWCGGCIIDGVCYADEDVDPSTPCRWCDLDASRTAWSPRDGASCDDGYACTTSDVCAAGVCAGTTVACDDGVICNGAESCDPGTGTCIAGAGSCLPTEICIETTDECVLDCATGCVLDGVCHAEGALQPGSDCLVCTGGSWQSDDGRACDDGLLCTTHDVCGAGTCAGTPLVCDDDIACNGLEVCNPAHGSCETGTPVCEAPSYCDQAADECVLPCAGCRIAGVCYPHGVTNPDDACELCDISRTSDAWSSVVCDDGVSCNGAETCATDTGLCVDGADTCTDGLVCDASLDECVAPL